MSYNLLLCIILNSSIYPVPYIFLKAFNPVLCTCWFYFEFYYGLNIFMSDELKQIFLAY